MIPKQFFFFWLVGNEFSKFSDCGESLRQNGEKERKGRKWVSISELKHIELSETEMT